MSVFERPVEPAPPDFMGYWPGGFFGPQISAAVSNQAVVGGAGGAANSRLYGISLFFLRRVRVDRLAAVIGTQVAAVNAKFGIASVDLATGGWDRLLCATAAQDFGGVADTAVLGTIAVGVEEIGPGPAWGLFVANGAAQPVTVAPGNVGSGGVAAIVGQTSPLGLCRTVATNNLTGISSTANVDFTTVLTTPGEVMPAFTRRLGLPGAPYVCWRAA